MAIEFLATIVAQMGSAWINSSRNKAHSKKMAEIQRAYEEKVAIEGIENARAEFAELCSFQREIEKQTHLDRLQQIRTNHEQTLQQIAYEKSLHKWPLLVPPYVIANAPLTLGESTKQCIPLNCILTTSANLAFNHKVFPRLEEKIAIFCSKFWNISADKSIRFFQEAWKDNANDLGSLHNDIYAHLKNVPTLLISPILKNETLLFRFYWWGLSLDPADVHVDELNELNPELSIHITSTMKYDEDITNLIVNECVPKLEAFISFFADLYYWNFYKEAPTLPLLIEREYLKLEASDYADYADSYKQLISKRLEDSQNVDISSELDYLESIAEAINPKDFSILVSKATRRIQNIPLFAVKDIIRISEFSKDFGTTSMSNAINLHISAKVEEIEIIDEYDSLSDDTIISFVQENISEAINAYYFAFIDWSDNMYIGTYCDDDFNPCIYSESNTIRFFVFRSIDYSISEPELNNHLLNIITITMSTKNNKLSGRERLGRHLINLGNRLCNDARHSNSSNQSSSMNGPWGDVSNNNSYDLSTIVNYFIEGVNNGTIHYTQRGSTMGLSDVLNWLDNLTDSQVEDTNQVYIIRGVYKEKKRVLYCVFLAKDEKFDLTSTTKECFICEAESEEMKDAFAGKSIYVIPFED